MNLPESIDHCLNCGAPLGGQYCGQCGQRATSRFISLWQLTTDAFGDLFELDSRLWRTLVPLMVRPGKLTREYLEGRRARYMPPFRMYLVLSLTFFLVAFFDPQSDFGILFEEDTEAGETRTDADVTPDADAEVPGEQHGFNVELDDDTEINCETGEYQTDELPAWLQRRLTPERLDHLCQRWEAAGEEGLAKAMLDRVPAGLILLLPLMALVLKLLYVFSGRYYVEHLLFFVHFHAFLFLLLTLQILWARFIGLVGLNEVLSVLVVVATSLYVPVYLFKAMRHVYGQGRFITFLKFLVLTFAYTMGFSFMLLGALFLAAISL